MISRLLRGKEKKIAPYSLERNAGGFIFTKSSNCTPEELIRFLLDLHMYVNPLNQDELQKFPDPTECVQYSFAPDASIQTTRSIDLLRVLKIGFMENSFESADALRSCSDDVVINSIRDLAILGNQVPIGRNLHMYNTSSVMPLDGILACVDLLLSILNSSQCFLEREYAFTVRLLPSLMGLLYVVDRIGTSIGHASNDVTKYQWTQTIGQAVKYLCNVAINVTVHNVNCTMDMDTDLPPLHGSTSMGLMVSMMQMLSSCVVTAREWCHPEAASTVALLYWALAEAVSDGVLQLQSKDRYISISYGSAEPSALRPECTRKSIWDHVEFIPVITHSIYKCVSNASPAPQDLLAGIGRLAGRTNDSYAADLSPDIGNETTHMLNWCTVAHTITGFKCLLRASVFSATGDRIALPRQNEWVAAVIESLLFCIEFGHRSRNLTLLSPVLAELLLELCVRQSDCSISVDTMFYELAMHLNKYSEAHKKKSRIEKKRRKKKKQQSGIQPALSRSTDQSDSNEKLDPQSVEVPSPSKAGAVKKNSEGRGIASPKALTVENFNTHNRINHPKIYRVNTDDSMSFDGAGSVHTDFDDFTKSPQRKNFVSEFVEKVDLYPSTGAAVPGSTDNTTAILSGTAAAGRGNLLQPITPFPGNSISEKPSNLHDRAVKSGLGALSVTTAEQKVVSPDGSPKKGKAAVAKGTPPLSPASRLVGPGSNSNIMSSPRAPVPHSTTSCSDTEYEIGQQVDCKITMKNDTKRWFSGKVETVNGDGTYNIRFDDGDLGENKLPIDIRVSKRSGRFSARSPSVRSEASLSARRSPALKPVSTSSALSVDVGTNSNTTLEAVSTASPASAAGGPSNAAGGESPAMFSKRAMNSSLGSNGYSFELSKFPIEEISPTDEPPTAFNSMKYSADDGDKGAKPYRPSDKMPHMLPAYSLAASLSSVANFESQELFAISEQTRTDSATDKSKSNSDKEVLVMTDVMSHDHDDVGSDDEDDGFTFAIPSVFAESDIARRQKMGEELVSKINFDNVDLDVTAAMNGAAQTSLSGGIVRDNDTTSVNKHSNDDNDDGDSGSHESGEEEEETGANSDDFGLAYLYDPNNTEEHRNSRDNGRDKAQSNSTLGVSSKSPDVHNIETDSEIQGSHSKDSSYSYSNSSGFAPVLGSMKRVPSLKGFSAATKDIEKYQTNTLGSFNMTSKNANQPPRPSSVPLSSNARSRNDPRRHSRGGGDLTSVNGGMSVTSNNSDCTGGSDPESRFALQRSYAFIALVLIERAVAQRDRIEEKFCRQEETMTTNRSRNSSFRVPGEYDPLSDAAMEFFGHRNIVFAVREFLETSVGSKVFAPIASNASLIDPATTRILKLIGEQYFDSCLPSHMESATKIADGAFGNVYSVSCPMSCSRCYSRRPMNQNSMNLCEDSVTLSGEDSSYAVKRISRERTVYDMPALIDVYTEVTCLEMLSRNRGICKLHNYGVRGGEYWLVLEEGKQDLLQWRHSISNNAVCSINDITMCVALFEDACVIVRNVHEAGIVHFDLKCSNFLLRGNPSIAVKWWKARKNHEAELFPSGVLFLADFGEAVINRGSSDGSSIVRGSNIYSDSNNNSGSPSPKRGGPTVLTSPKFRSLLKEEVWPGVDVKRARGTLYVQSPEMLTISSGTKSSSLPQREGKLHKQKKGSKEGWISFPSPSYQSDVWSLGCLLVELLTMAPLFGERPWPELYCMLCMKGKKAEIDNNVVVIIDNFMNTNYVTLSTSACTQFFSELKKIIPSILVQKPTERLSITAILGLMNKQYSLSLQEFVSPQASVAGPPVGDQASVDSWDPNISPSESSFPIAGNDGKVGRKPNVKKQKKKLSVTTTTGPMAKYAENKSILLCPTAVVVDRNAVPAGRLYTDVQDYISSAVDSFDNAKMVPSTFSIAPKLYVALSVSENDIFSYNLSNSHVVDITEAPSGLYEYNTSNILGECMNKVRNSEKYVSIASHNAELVQKTFGYLHKDKRLVEIFLVCEPTPSESGNEYGDWSDASAGCFSFKLKRRNNSSGGKSNKWVPWRRNSKVFTENDRLGYNDRRQVYKFNLGVGDPAKFFECFKHAVILVHECIEAGYTVVLSINGKPENTATHADHASSRAGSSRWTVQNDGPGPALSARSMSFDSNMRKLFNSEMKLPSARSLADSRDGESSYYPSTIGTRVSVSSGPQKAVHADFSRPLVSALSALASYAAIMTKTYSCFYDQPTAPLEKMSPWLLRGSQKETVVCLLQYCRAVIPLKWETPADHTGSV